MCGWCMCVLYIKCLFGGRDMFFFFKQKTSYEMRISDWSSDVCSSDLGDAAQPRRDREADDRDLHQPLASESAGEPAGERRHDRGGDDVRGQYPGDLIGRGRHTAAHVRQRDVDEIGTAHV